MTHGQPHEEAEHASHHAADPFDKRVAMSMVVIAALLAGVKVMGHRTHNDTLAYQIQSGVSHTQESDLWNFFQSKKMREVLAKQQATILGQSVVVPAPKGSADEKAVLKNKDKRIAAVQKDLEELIESLETEAPAEKVGSPSEEAQAIVNAGEKRYKELVAQGAPPDVADRIAAAEIASMRYRSESRIIGKKANEKKKDAQTAIDKGAHKHHQADYFDLGELGVELALVLSSVAILTKRSGYWYSGLAVCGLGLIAVSAGFFAH